MQTVTLKVDGMKCDGCASAVQSALERIEGVSEVDVSVAGGSATVRIEPTVDRSLLFEAIAEAGYQAS